jgi:hypothetical protein
MMLRETIFLLTASCLLAAVSNVVADGAAAQPDAAAGRKLFYASASSEQLFYMSDMDAGQHEDSMPSSECDLPRSTPPAPPSGPAEVADEESEEDDDWVDRDLPEEDNDQEGEQRDGETDGPAQEDEPWREPYKQMTFMKLLESGFKWNYENQYKKINKYLVEKTESRDVEDNMSIAAKWLEEQQKFVLPFWNGALVEALKQFLDLTRLNDEDVRCSREAYVILWRNNQATKDKALTERHRRRIDNIVRHFRINHAINCYTVYPGRFEDFYAEMDVETERWFTTFQMELNSRFKSTKEILDALAGKTFAQIAHRLIGSNSFSDPDNKYLHKTENELDGGLFVYEPGVRRLAERYVIRRCRQFVQQAGPEIFIPASFDQLALNPEDRYKICSMPEARFLHGRQLYRICEKLVRHDSEAFVKQLAKVVGEQRSP